MIILFKYLSWDWRNKTLGKLKYTREDYKKKKILKKELIIILKKKQSSNKMREKYLR